MKSINKNDKGFSLVEVLVSLVILAIIIVPILDNFIVAARVNNKARKMQSATTIAQNVLEGIKATDSLKTLAHQFNDPTLFDLILKGTSTVSELSKSPTGTYSTIVDDTRTYIPLTDTYKEKTNDALDPAIYYFGIAGIQDENSTYDALVTYDGTTNYRTTSGPSPSPGLEKTNDFEMPVLSDIARDKNAIVTQTFEDNWGKDTLYVNYTSYSAQKLAENPLAPLPILSPEDIDAAMSRNITITIDYDVVTSKYTVKCNYVYKTPEAQIPQSSNLSKVTYELYNKTMGSTLENIYLFLDPILRSTSALQYDSINIINNVSIEDKAKVKVYLIEQARVKTVYDAAHGIDSYANQLVFYKMHAKIDEPYIAGAMCTSIFTNIASANMEYTGKSFTVETNPLIEHELDTRLYDVKVEIFKAATSEAGRYLPADLLATLRTTKGE